MKEVQVRDFKIGPDKLTVICGPCIIESENFTLDLAEKIKKELSGLPIHLIFKASYDKANRSSVKSFRGPGIEKGLQILQKVQNNLDLPILTDVHSPQEATQAGSICDIIQIPAFLCRQTDLLLSAGKTKAAINVKKGQFVAPWDMKYVVEKIESTRNHNILLTDRGTCFGYNNLVSDMRSIPIMQSLNYPVCFDATHSVQLPGGGASSGGAREFIPPLARAAIAAGANAIFLECHPNPEQSKSDASCVFHLKNLRQLITQLLQIYEILHDQTYVRS